MTREEFLDLKVGELVLVNDVLSVVKSIQNGYPYPISFDESEMQLNLEEIRRSVEFMLVDTRSNRVCFVTLEVNLDDSFNDNDKKILDSLTSVVVIDIHKKGSNSLGNERKKKVKSEKIN